jgi:hypothetical protein
MRALLALRPRALLGESAVGACPQQIWGAAATATRRSSSGADEPTEQAVAQALSHPHACSASDPGSATRGGSSSSSGSNSERSGTPPAALGSSTRSDSRWHHGAGAWLPPAAASGAADSSTTPPPQQQQQQQQQQLKLQQQGLRWRTALPLPAAVGSPWPRPPHQQHQHAHQQQHQQWRGYRGAAKRVVHPLPPALQAALEAASAPPARPPPPPLEPRPLQFGSRRAGAIAIKAGMTQEWDEFGARVPLTVLWVDDCVVARHKTASRDGADALVLAAGAKKEKQLHPRQIGEFKAHGEGGVRRGAAGAVSLWAPRRPGRRGVAEKLGAGVPGLPCKPTMFAEAAAGQHLARAHPQYARTANAPLHPP